MSFFPKDRSWIKIHERIAQVRNRVETVKGNERGSRAHGPTRKFDQRPELFSPGNSVEWTIVRYSPPPSLPPLEMFDSNLLFPFSLSGTYDSFLINFKLLCQLTSKYHFSPYDGPIGPTRASRKGGLLARICADCDLHLAGTRGLSPLSLSPNGHEWRRESP